MSSQVNFNPFNESDMLGVPIVDHGTFTYIRPLDRSKFYPPGLELGADNGLGPVFSSFPAQNPGLPYSINGNIPIYFDGQQLRDNDLYFMQTTEPEPKDMPEYLPSNHELDSELNVYPDGSRLGPLTQPSEYEQKMKRRQNLSIYNGIISRANQLRPTDPDQADEMLRRAEKFLIETAPDLITVVQSNKPVVGFAPIKPVGGHVFHTPVKRTIQNLQANLDTIQKRQLRQRQQEMNALLKTGAIRGQLRSKVEQLNEEINQQTLSTAKEKRRISDPTLSKIPGAAGNQGLLQDLENTIAQLRFEIEEEFEMKGLQGTEEELATPVPQEPDEEKKGDQQQKSQTLQARSATAIPSSFPSEVGGKKLGEFIDLLQIKPGVGSRMTPAWGLKNIKAILEALGFAIPKGIKAQEILDSPDVKDNMPVIMQLLKDAGWIPPATKKRRSTAPEPTVPSPERETGATNKSLLGGIFGY